MEGRWSLRRVPIKVRLALCFAALLVLMLLGSVLSFWHFRNLHSYVARVSLVEQRVSAMLRLNNRLLTLMGQLHRSAEGEAAGSFEADAHRLLELFHSQTTNEAPKLEEIARESDRHAILAASIRAMLQSLPARIESLVELARRGDWIALHARLLNQADQTDDVVTALMQQVDADLINARKRLFDDLSRARKRAANILAVTAVLSLTAAALLGAIVTRSITRPLVNLDAGARALASGDFGHRVSSDGGDELAHLARVFNRTAEELADLFDQVRRERSSAEAAQAALRERAQELARANADLQQFAYSASHDLQEPLRMVAIYSQLLQKKYAGQLDGRADEYIGYLFRSARQMERLLTDLLAYTQLSRTDNIADARTEVNPVLQRVLSTLEARIQAQHCTITAGPLPAVRAQEVHVQQLLQNLLTNAMKYRSDIDPCVHIWAERTQDNWLFAVRDNGIGIEPQYATQIFGIFKRLHGQKYEGTGIGLAICQRIVEGYGGRIWVDSEFGKGATFRFTLPAA